MTTNAVQLSGFDAANPTSTLKYTTGLPLPAPAAGQLRVHLQVRPVNPSDLFSIMGVYPGFAPKSFPAVPGLEGMGVVDELGEGVSGLTKGQRVFAMVDGKGGNGSWQEHVVVPSTHVVPIPDSVSDEVAAQFLVNPVTTYGMLEVLGVPKGEYLIQSAAGSVLGRMLIQLAKVRGVKTINIVRRAEQKDELKALGADEVISSTDENVVERVKEITGGKLAYGGLDCVAGEMTNTLCDSVRNGGTVLVYGAMSGTDIKTNVVAILFRDVHVRGFWLNYYFDNIGVEGMQKAFAEVMGLLANKTIEPLVGEKFPLKDVAKAVEASQKTARGGKVLLVN